MTPRDANSETLPFCGPPPAPAELAAAWNTDPGLAFLLVAALTYGLAAASNRGLFLIAWIVLVLAFVSPLCALTTALFSARTLHHLLLISLAAPLLALSLPLRSRAPAPLVPALLTALALVLWHLPAVYRAAWNSTGIYALMQTALLAPATLFWSGVLTPGREAGSLLLNAALIAALAMVMGLIGAVLTFAPLPLYPEHIAAPLAWGLEPLEDQQLAGLIMWLPGFVPLALTALLIARRAWRFWQAEAAL